MQRMVFPALSLRELLSHMGKNHKSDGQFHALCGLDGCARTYKNLYSYRNHINSKHSLHLLDVSNRETQAANNVATATSAGGEGDDDHDGIENEDDLDLEAHMAKQALELQKTSAFSILQLKEKGRVPQTVVDTVVNSWTEVVQETTKVLKDGMKRHLSVSGVEFEAIPGLADLFNEDSFLTNPFRGLETQHLQHKYYVENFDLVVST